MWLRTYNTADCAQLAELFYQTVHSVNARDYTKRQLDAWVAGEIDLTEWDKFFLEHKTMIAVENCEIIGFGDMDHSGYLDKLFVLKDHQQGIATAICDELERSDGIKTFTTHASITAKPFFKRRGYYVVQP